MGADRVSRVWAQARYSASPSILWGRRVLCLGHSSEGFPVLSLGMATSSSTAQPGPSAWRTSPKATSNGSTSKAVPSPRAPSCLPPAASSLLSTGTCSLFPCAAPLGVAFPPIHPSQPWGLLQPSSALLGVGCCSWEAAGELPVLLELCGEALAMHRNPSAFPVPSLSPQRAWLHAVLPCRCCSDLSSVHMPCAPGR